MYFTIKCSIMLLKSRHDKSNSRRLAMLSLSWIHGWLALCHLSLYAILFLRGEGLEHLGGHVFHSTCIAQYKSASGSGKLRCPNCRQTVRTIAPIFFRMGTTREASLVRGLIGTQRVMMQPTQLARPEVINLQADYAEEDNEEVEQLVRPQNSLSQL